MPQHVRDLQPTFIHHARRVSAGRSVLRRWALAALLACGCLAPAQPVRAEGPGAYLRSRWLDLRDIFSLRVSGAKQGHGGGVMIRATALAQLGAVYFDGEHAGMDRRAIGVWRERRIQGAIGPLAITEIETRTKRGNEFAYDRSPWGQERERGIERNGEFWDDGRRHILACGVEIQPGILPGFEFRADPLEIIDFLVGWTTIDIFDDDVETTTPWSPDGLTSGTLKKSKPKKKRLFDPFETKPASDEGAPEPPPLDKMRGLGRDHQNADPPPAPLPPDDAEKHPASSDLKATGSVEPNSKPNPGAQLPRGERQPGPTNPPKAIPHPQESPPIPSQAVALCSLGVTGIWYIGQFSRTSRINQIDPA